MKNFKAAQRRYDISLPAEHFDSLSGDEWNIEKSDPDKPFFRSLSGPAGEYLAVREIDGNVTEIEVDCLDDVKDNSISIEFAPDLVWEDLENAHINGPETLARLLNDADRIGARAFQDPPDVDEILNELCDNLFSVLGINGVVGDGKRRQSIEILRNAYNKGRES